jgi:DNA-binding transcriptional MerR regulator
MTGSVQYRIGKFARVSGVTVKTLRLYDEIGLLRLASVNPLTGYRSYAPEQLEELAAILALRELGVSLSDIRTVKRNGRIPAGRRELLKELRSRAKKAIQAAARTLQWIEAELDGFNDTIAPVPVLMKRRPAMLIASMRAKVGSYEEIERYEEMLLGSVPREAMAETRGVLWHRCADSGSLEGEP